MENGVHVNFKGDNTIRSPLVTQNDKDNITKKTVVTCRYKYDMLVCDEVQCLKSHQILRPDEVPVKGMKNIYTIAKLTLMLKDSHIV